MRKNHNFSHTNLATTIQPKPETGSPFFANLFVKIAVNNPVAGRPSGGLAS